MNHRISPLGAHLFFGLCMRAYSSGGGDLKIFGHIQVETFLLLNYFFDATHVNRIIFFKRQANLR